MKEKTFRLLLLRHGETAANKEKRYAGAADIPLSDEGREKLYKLKAKGLYPDVSGYLPYTTNLLRTKQTLSAIWPDSVSAALPAFNEMDFGVFEMHTYEELKDDPDYQRWISDSTGSVACPKGESANQFRQRVAAGLKALTAKRQDALLVTHGGVIAYVMQMLFPGANRHFYQWQPANGCGYLIEFSGDTAVSYTDIHDQARRKESIS